MKSITLKLSSILLIGLTLSQNCIVGSNITYAQNAPDGYVEVAIYNNSIYPIKINGSHLGPVGETKSGMIKRSRVGNIYTQENGNTIIQPGGQGLYQLNKNSDYKYTPKEIQANGKEVSLDSKHGDDFKTDRTWTIVGSGALAATPLAGVNPVVAPVTQAKIDKKAARRAARNAVTPLVGPNPVVNGAAPVAEVVNNNYYAAPVAAAVAGPNPVVNAATPLVGPNPIARAVVNNNNYNPVVGPNQAVRAVANNNPLAIRREQMLAAQQRALNNGPVNNYANANYYQNNNNYSGDNY